MKGSMKKLASLTVAGGMLLSISAPAFAADTTSNTTTQTQASTSTNVQAGITPDSPFYFVDKIYEDLQLLFTQNVEARAKLLADLSNERKAELNVLATKHQDGQISNTEFNKLSTEVLQNYKERLNQAIDELTKLKEQTSNQTSTQSNDQTSTNSTTSAQSTTQNSDQATQTDQTKATSDSQSSSGTSNQSSDSVNAIETDIQSAGDINTDSLKGNDQAEKDAQDIKAAVAVVVNGYDQAKVQDLRKKGFGYGAIAHIFALSDASHKSVDDIVKLLSSHKGFGKLAKDLGLSPSVLGAGAHIKAMANTSNQTNTSTSSTDQANNTTDQQTNATTTTSGDQTTSTQSSSDQQSTTDQSKATSTNNTPTTNKDQQRTTVNAVVNVGKVTVGAKATEHEREHGKHSKKNKSHGKSGLVLKGHSENNHSGMMKQDDQEKQDQNGEVEDQQQQSQMSQDSHHDNEQGDRQDD